MIRCARAFGRPWCWTAAARQCWAPGDTYRLRVQDSDVDKRYPIPSRSYPAAPPRLGRGRRPDLHRRRHHGHGRPRDPVQGAVADPLRRPRARAPDGRDARRRPRGRGRRVPAVRGSTGAVDDVRGPAIALAFADGRYRVRPGDALTADADRHQRHHHPRHQPGQRCCWSSTIRAG